MDNNVKIPTGPELGYQSPSKSFITWPFIHILSLTYQPVHQYSNKAKRKVLDYLYAKRLTEYRKAFKKSQEIKQSLINDKNPIQSSKVVDVIDYKLIESLYKVKVRSRRNSFIFGCVVTAIFNASIFAKSPLRMKNLCFLICTSSCFIISEYKINQKIFDSLFWLFMVDASAQDDKKKKENDLIERYLLKK